jgi:hypothetical protein
MRRSLLLLLVLLAACAPDGSDLPTGPSDRPQLVPGTCGLIVSQTTDTLFAPPNTSGNFGGDWILERANSVGVTLVSEVRFNSGSVTSTSASGTLTYPYVMPASPQEVGADMLFTTGSVGMGDIHLRVKYVCADGGDTLTKKLGTIFVNVDLP